VFRDSVKREGVVGDKESVRRREKKRTKDSSERLSRETSVRNYHHSLRNKPEEHDVVFSGVNADSA